MSGFLKFYIQDKQNGFRLDQFFYMNNLTDFSGKGEALEMKIDVLVSAASISLTVYFQLHLHGFCLIKQTKNKTTKKN